MQVQGIEAAGVVQIDPGRLGRKLRSRCRAIWPKACEKAWLAASRNGAKSAWARTVLSLFQPCRFERPAAVAGRQRWMAMIQPVCRQISTRQVEDPETGGERGSSTALQRGLLPVPGANCSIRLYPRGLRRLIADRDPQRGGSQSGRLGSAAWTTSGQQVQIVGTEPALISVSSVARDRYQPCCHLAIDEDVSVATQGWTAIWSTPSLLATWIQGQGQGVLPARWWPW